LASGTLRKSGLRASTVECSSDVTCPGVFGPG
jgi:hypothetical protein